MNLRSKLEEVSEKMHTLIKNQEGVTMMPTEDFGWENYRYESEYFRLAHVERFFQEGMLVVHVTVIPTVDRATPIYGFDIVANEKNNKIMAAFVDYSPTIRDTKWHNESWDNDKRLPAWANIFSDGFVAIKPSPDEYDKLFDFALTKMAEYFQLLNQSHPNDNLTEYVIEKQNLYCHNQASNKKTFAALKRIIGADRAKYFMEHILFPKA